MDFSVLLFKLRAGNGYTQETLAEVLGVSRQSVTKWETGRAVPEFYRLTDMAYIFDVPILWLFCHYMETLGIINPVMMRFGTCKECIKKCYSCPHMTFPEDGFYWGNKAPKTYNPDL